MEESQVEQFAAWLEASGNTPKTIANYVHCLDKIQSDFGREVAGLILSEDQYQDVLRHYSENITDSLKSYRTALSAYRDFSMDECRGQIDLSDEKGKKKTWFPEYEIEEVDGWWQSLSSILNGDSNERNGLWVFRGQGFDRWGLETSLGRVAVKNGKFQRCGNKLKRHENDSMWEFSREASKDVEFRGFKDADLLALMQHYGCKTRFLDFSLSPLVALFMALDQNSMDMGSVRAYHQIYAKEGVVASASIALWAIDITRIGSLANPKCWKQFVRSQFKKAAKIIAARSDCPYQGITAVFPQMCNRRVAAQDGLFLMPDRLDSSFEENLCRALRLDIKEYKTQYHVSVDARCFESGIVKFVFPENCIDKLWKILRDANVTAKTVYPDLTGLGKYVGSMISF